MHFDAGNQGANPREFLMRIVQDEARPEEWKVLMKKGNRVGYIDRMHEGYRRHPRTLEKFEHKYKMFRLLEDPVHRGRCSGEYRLGDSLQGWIFMVTLPLQTKSSSTYTTSATADRTR